MGKSLSIRDVNFSRSFRKSLDKLPPKIAKKAKAISRSIEAGCSTERFECKRLFINRDVMSFKVGSRYRLLMVHTGGSIVPWVCLSHENYNNFYMRICA